MKRVYLDQNKWIDLAHAAAGGPRGVKFGDALLLAEAGVERCLVSFPLSSAHYVETSHIRDRRRREELADLMLRLSRRHSIAPQSAIVPAEIDAALKSRFGRPLRPRVAQVFGIGSDHAFGRDRGQLYHVPPEWHLDPDVAQQIERVLDPLVRDQWEVWLLRGFPEAFTRGQRGEPAAAYAVTELFAEEQEKQRLKLRQEGWHAGERGKRFAKANVLRVYGKPITEAMIRAGLRMEQLSALGRDGLTALTKAIPLIDVDSELERQHHASNKSWQPNDLNDIDALVRAIPYCDMVVAEKQWIHYARTARFDQKYGTILLTDLSELPQHLV